MPSRIRKGDLVAVISGNDRGKRGRVLRILHDRDRVVVEGVNLVYKHLRRSQQHPQGGRVQRESPVHLSNVMPVDPESNEPTRVAYRTSEGRRARFGRRSGAPLDGGARGAKKAPETGSDD